VRLDKEACTLNLAPHRSTTAQNGHGALSVALLDARGFRRTTCDVAPRRAWGASC